MVDWDWFRKLFACRVRAFGPGGRHRGTQGWRDKPRCHEHVQRSPSSARGTWEPRRRTGRRRKNWATSSWSTSSRGCRRERPLTCCKPAPSRASTAASSAPTATRRPTAPTWSSSPPAWPANPGMSRDDLLRTNYEIVSRVVRGGAWTALPKRYIIVVSNPVDVMTYVALKESGFPKNRVMGRRASSTRPASAPSSRWSWASPSRTSPPSSWAPTATPMVPLVRYSYAGRHPGREAHSQGAPRRHRRADPLRRRRDRQPAQDGQRLLRPGARPRADGGGHPQGQEAHPPRHRLPGRRVRPAATSAPACPSSSGAGGVEKVIEIDLTDEEREAFLALGGQRSAGPCRSSTSS